jgi:hypothetical protein
MALPPNTLGRAVPMRYVMITPVLALKLCNQNGRPSGVITSLPQNVPVGLSGTSEFATGMIEVSWQGERYAVFERDFKARAVLEGNASSTDD